MKCVKERVEDEPYEAGRDAEEDTQYDEDDSAGHGGSGSSEEDVSCYAPARPRFPIPPY